MAASAAPPGPCRTRGGHPDHGGPSGTVPKTRRGAEPRAISRRPLPGKRMHAKTRGRWRTSRRGDTAFLVPSLPARPSGRPPASVRAAHTDIHAPMRQTPEPCLLRAAHAAAPRTGGTGTGYAHGMRTPDLRASPPAGGGAPETPDAGMPLTRRPAAGTRVRRTQRSGCAPARTDPRTAGAAPGPLTPSRAAPRNRPRSDRSSSAGNPPSATACRTDSLGPACSRCL